jgi:poly(3-hydroxybutyrate) depolymerase
MPNLLFNSVTVGLILFFHSASLGSDRGPIDIGAGQFIFEYQDEKNSGQLTVWTYRPKEFVANGRVLFVMHGARRNGERYRNQWIAHAQRANALLLVPEFSPAGFASGRNYSAPNPEVDSDDQAPFPFLAIERIFDHILSIGHLETKEYHLYGHSAGAQFVHRFILFTPRARVTSAVAANAGWYTMPDFTVPFP